MLGATCCSLSSNLPALRTLQHHARSKEKHPEAPLLCVILVCDCVPLLSADHLGKATTGGADGGATAQERCDVDVSGGERCACQLHFIEALEAGRGCSRWESQLCGYNRLFQGRTVADADRQADGACLPLPPGIEVCECGAVVLHASHESRELHRGWIPEEPRRPARGLSEAARRMLCQAEHEPGYAD